MFNFFGQILSVYNNNLIIILIVTLFFILYYLSSVLLRPQLLHLKTVNLSP
jgi:hypothetical protein